MYDLVIIGGGPAGLTAALYALHKHLNVLLISENMGGKTNYHMVFPDDRTLNLIRGVNLIQNFRQELETLHLNHRLESVKQVIKDDDDIFRIKLGGGNEIPAASVLIATGSNVRHLNVPGEHEFIGRGVGYSAVSYAPMYPGKHVAVIGDGMLALRAVAELLPIAAKVSLVAPTHGVLDTPMAKTLTADTQKIAVFEEYTVKGIAGHEFAEKVLVESPTGETAEIQTDGIFIELGLVPNTGIVKGVVNLDNKGRIIIDNANRTNCLGLFAAGDVTNAYAEQVLVAVGEGAKAALSAYEYLSFRKALALSPA